MSLIGCPFCGELYSAGEEEICPVCGVALRSIEKLPLSYEARIAQAAELAAVPPEDRLVPWWYAGRGRGALVVVALLGIAAFFLPWIDLHKPDEISYSGYHLARARGSWFFGGAIGWFVTIPLVVTRRTVFKMRGVRIITATFSALTVLETAQLLISPPHGGRYLPVAFDWGYGLYMSLILGLLGVAFAARFGGRLDDIDVRELSPEPTPDLSPDQADSRTLH